MAAAQDIEEAVTRALDEAPTRNFTETVDLAVNLRDPRPQRPIESSRREHRAPRRHRPGNPNRRVRRGRDRPPCRGGRRRGPRRERPRGARRRRRCRQRTSAGETDFFIAEAGMMQDIGRYLGTVFGPRGKMPTPLQPDDDVVETINRMKNTVQVRSRDRRTFHTRVGAAGHGRPTRSPTTSTSSYRRLDGEPGEAGPSTSTRCTSRPRWAPRWRWPEMSADAESEATDHQTEHVPEWKREEVASLSELIASYESVGIVSVAGIPSRQLQAMRRELQGSAELRVARNTLLTPRARGRRRAASNELVDEVEGQVGLIGTNENPFGLYKQLEASKTPAPINAGEVSPNDIVDPRRRHRHRPGSLRRRAPAGRRRGAHPGRFDPGHRRLHGSRRGRGGLEATSRTSSPNSVSSPRRSGSTFGPSTPTGFCSSPTNSPSTSTSTARTSSPPRRRGGNLSINAAYPTAQTAARARSARARARPRAGYGGRRREPRPVRGPRRGRADAQLRALAANIDDEEALPEELRGAIGAVGDHRRGRRHGRQANGRHRV